MRTWYERWVVEFTGLVRLFARWTPVLGPFLALGLQLHESRRTWLTDVDGNEPWPEPTPQPGGPSQPYPLPPPLRGAR